MSALTALFLAALIFMAIALFTYVRSEGQGGKPALYFCVKLLLVLILASLFRTCFGATL